MKIIGIFEAKTKLSKICEDVVATGEPSVISKHGEPLVKIVPYNEVGGPSSVWDTIEEGAERFGQLDEDWESPGRTIDTTWGDGIFDQN